MKKLWHLFVLLALAIVLWIIGFSFVLSAGGDLKTLVNKANKQQAQLQEFIGFKGPYPEQPEPIESLVAHFDNQFTLIDHGFSDMMKAQLFKRTGNSFQVVANSQLKLYQAGGVMIEIVAPVLFGLLLCDSLYTIYLFKTRIMLYQNQDHHQTRTLRLTIKKDIAHIQKVAQANANTKTAINEKRLQKLQAKIKKAEQRKALATKKIGGQQTHKPSVIASVPKGRTIAQATGPQATEPTQKVEIKKAEQRKAKDVIKKTRKKIVPKAKSAQEQVTSFADLLKKQKDNYNIGDYIDHEGQTYKIVNITNITNKAGQPAQEIVVKNNATNGLSKIVI